VDDPEPASPVIFDADGAPRSARYGDVYFSKAGGLAETRAVFLAGCGLPERWAGRSRFTVAELGFGTGLNIAALLALWRANRPPDARLSIFSVEAEPLTAEVAARALAAFPELAQIADLLTSRWPGRAHGFHRVDLPELGATLDVAVMEAADALAAWRGRADAWFLDGFAPAVNAAMWTDALMALVAARSAPAARTATYTVAGQARRALAAAGFTVERRPGFGAKRERLEACLPGEPEAARTAPRVAIVGAGIAGAALARAFTALGAAPRVFDAEGAGGGASGMPAALVTPRLDAGLGAIARLHALAFARAVRLYDALEGAVVARGVLQLEVAPRDAARFAKIAGSDLFEPGALEPLSADAVSERLGEPAPPVLLLTGARVIEPAGVLRTWLPAVAPHAVAAVEPAGASWRLVDAAGQVVAEAEIVCLSAGAGLAALWPGAPIQPVRGQLSWAEGAAAPAAAAWGAYVAPTPTGLMFGSTHDRDDAATEHRAGDDARNLAALATRLPQLAARLAGVPLHGRAAVRATTSDRLPVAGPIAPGLFVLGGFGARGFALAPLLAEHVAAEALGAPSPLPGPFAAIVDPARFAERARRRGMAQSAPRV
jgi:tRNA 5-methylaminomethyl-2-thiouridine biosynthesis bifunctional protein